MTVWPWAKVLAIDAGPDYRMLASGGEGGGSTYFVPGAGEGEARLEALWARLAKGEPARPAAVRVPAQGRAVAVPACCLRAGTS
jgi:predicted ATPase